MARYVFDVETNGFLDQLDRIHILVLRDPDQGERMVFRRNGSEDTIQKGLKLLAQADQIIGHNVISFDLPAIDKVYGVTFPREKVKDTYVQSKLYFGNIKEEDFKNKKLPKNLYGGHSIEAWGHRVNVKKVGTDIKDWSQWTQEMEDRCVSDVEVNVEVFKRIEALKPWTKAELLEHEAQWLCSQIERNGVPFDVTAAVELYGVLIEIRERMAGELKELFPPWVVYQGEVVSKANNRKTGHTIGAVYSKVLIQEFNPRSRDHIADRLKTKYGWKPTEFTDGGKPKVDETVLVGLDYPEAQPLAELFLIMKRIGQIAEGKEAWLKHEKDGWIHYRLNPNAAVTSRASHSKPNISQVPKVGSRYGKECRAMFGLILKALEARGLLPAWKDAVLYGSDVAGLELRMLAHFMHRYDAGAYGLAVIEGKEEDGTDVHSLNTCAIGLEPQKVYVINGKQKKGRDAGKTFIYAFLYGEGDEERGKKVGVSDDEIDSVIERGRKVYPPGFKVSITRLAEKRLKREGRKGKRALATLVKGALTKLEFLDKTPALKSLQEAVDKASARGYLIALDGRHMHVRSPHAALNTLLQGAGAVVCKKWIVETDRLLQEKGFKHGWDGDYAVLIWAHDEQQIACRTPEIVTIVDACSKQAIKITEAYFGIKLPLDVGGKTGVTWKDTH